MKLYKLEPDNKYFTNRCQVAKYLGIQQSLIDLACRLKNGKYKDYIITPTEDPNILNQDIVG